MKTIDIKQNSEEWEEFRKGKSGGSELKDLWIAKSPTKEDVIERIKERDPSFVIEKGTLLSDLLALLDPVEIASIKLKRSPKKKYYEMLADKVAKPLTPNDYADRLNGEPFSAMARGHILEPEIAENFARQYHKKLEETGVWVSDTNPNSYISPDRVIVSEDGKIREAVEIKAFYSPEVLEIWKTQKIPTEYMPQIVKYFMINEDLETLYWVVGTDLIPGLELQVFPVQRKDVEDKIREIEAFENAYLDMLNEDIAKLDKIAGF
ncbi:MAG: YqaJ viral recombinase family protein [Clostridiales bacterium]|nr:YqaJ viral recombinase family protein [Clostridiales bacterium]